MRLFRFGILLTALVMMALQPAMGNCAEMSTAQIMAEIEALKKRIDILEQVLKEKDQKIKDLAVQEKKKAAPAPEVPSDKWTDRITLSGAVTAEYGNVSVGNRNGTSDNSEDIVLSTVEVGIEAVINRYTTAEVLFLYEEDDNENFSVDEATFTLGGIPETFGLYTKGGKYYPRFGVYNNYLVSDPLTQQLFETQESAIEIGYEGAWLGLGVGVFNGDIDKIGADTSEVRGYFADVHFNNPEGSLGGFSVVAGASYLSSVADSDTLQGQASLDTTGDGNPDNVVNQLIGGVALYMIVEKGPFSLGAEYISALGDFRAGEMGYANDRNGTASRTQPTAWNFELAYRFVETLQLALRYEGSRDMYHLLPERQYGVGVSFSGLENTTISAEYMHGQYDSNNNTGVDDRDAITVEVAVEY